tara:strand:- start:617 stop:811 length:195 start_codon:yes stop_codon:yes gene_type:complete
MKYTTVMIQLSSDSGTPVDYPDDWAETVFSIAQMLHAKYRCGLDITYGLASKKTMIDLDKEVNK